MSARTSATFTLTPFLYSTGYYSWNPNGISSVGTTVSYMDNSGAIQLGRRRRGWHRRPAGYWVALTSTGQVMIRGLSPNATYFLILVTILHESWGSQSWLQPAFSRRLRLRRLAHGAKSRLKGGCGQDCPPHNECRMLGPARCELQ